MDLLLSFLILAQGSGRGDAPDAGPGIGIILGTLVLVTLLVLAVWTFVAKRGSRVPKRDPHDPSSVGS
jgi:hypothetical protein